MTTTGVTGRSPAPPGRLARSLRGAGLSGAAYAVALTVMAAPEVKAGLNLTGRASLNVATGWSLVPRLVAKLRLH
jgi:hypothetical protein